MKTLRRIMSISAVLVCLYGLGLIFFPQFVANEYGMTLTTTTIPLAQLLGAYFIGFGILNCAGSKSTAHETLFIITLADFVTDFITVLISGTERYHGILNVWGWEIFILHLFFMSAFGYYLLKLRQSMQAPVL